METPASLRKCWLCFYWKGDQKSGRGWCLFDKSRMKHYLDTCDKWKSTHGESDEDTQRADI